MQQTPARLQDHRLPRSWAGGLLVLGTLLVYIWQVAFDIEFANHTGEYSACIGNTLMSALFLHRGVTSADLRGQRFSIAVAKGVGSALYVAPIFALTHSSLLLAQGLLCAILDIAYGLVLVHRLAPRSTIPSTSQGCSDGSSGEVAFSL